MYKVKLMNKISSEGLDYFNEDYEYGETLENEDAINQDLYLKRMKDANGKDDYYMWQVTTGIRVTFDKNGGETEASPKTSLQDYVAGKTNYHFDLPTKNPTRKGYTFKGWNTKADGSGTTFTDATTVTFKKLSDQEIEDYLDTNEWQGKAGAYAIQGVASKFVEKIDGDLENVIGMPMYKVIKYLEA